MKLKKFALRGMIFLAAAIALCILFSGTIRTLTTPKVRYASVRMGRFEKVAELTGKVSFPETEAIGPAVPEGITLTVTSVAVTDGQRVRAGEKLLTAEVTDAEKTLETLEQEYESARSTLENWERKNESAARLSRNETLWMEAYEASRAADKAEREARLDLTALLRAWGIEEIPETVPEEADAELAETYENWQNAVTARTAARETLKGLERYAVPDDVWTLLQQKKDAEKKLEDTESRIMEIRLMMKRTGVITAPHDGYIAEVKVKKGDVYTGEDTMLLLTQEGKNPVIRADISDVKGVQKGSVMTVKGNSWYQPEVRVTATGLSITGHPYADLEITDDVVYAIGAVSEIMKEDVKLQMTTRAQESTCLVPASAIRGSGDGRYVFTGEQENSAFAGKKIIVRKTAVTVLAESASTVSIAEDLTYSKVIYMEDRTIEEGGTVMLYEE